jgi:hypothetical protein
MIRQSTRRLALQCVVLGIGAAAVLAPLAGAAKEAPKDKERPPIVDPRARELLRAMSEYLAGAKTFTVRATLAFDHVLPSGQKIQLGAVEDVAVMRPNRAYVEYDGDVGSKRLWYDGKALTMYDPIDGVYASAPMPGNIDAMFDKLLKDYGFSPPLSDLVYSDPYKILIPHAQFGVYLGEHPIDGVRCHHLAFVDKTIDWQIWIEDGTQVVPHRIVITYVTQPEAPQFQATFSDWTFGDRLIDAQFQPQIPPGTGKIEFLPSAVNPTEAPAPGKASGAKK